MRFLDWREVELLAAPQVPWVGSVEPFVLRSLGQFLPGPLPSLQSNEWVETFNEIKAYGAANSSVRSPEQTAIARFWSANVVRQYNRVGRDLTGAGSNLLDAARLAAMINLVGADALMSTLARQVPLPLLAAGHRGRSLRRDRRRLRPSPRLRRREPGNGRGSGLAAAVDHAQPPGVSGGAR
jgi:hypothetical protein